MKKNAEVSHACLIRLRRVSASINTAFAFSLVWGHNACVSNACLHLLPLRFPWYGVTMHVFHTRVCIWLLRCLWYGAKVHVFLLSLAFAFSLVWRYNACIWHACLHMAFALSMVWRESTCVSRASLHLLRQLLHFPFMGSHACVSHASLHILRRILRFTSYRVTMHAFHTRFCIG